MRSGSAWLGLLGGVATCVAGCGGLVPERPDLAPTAVTSADVTMPPDVPSGVACERDEDCAAYAGCCYDLVCAAGACEPRVLEGCCSELGPCATSGAFEAGECVARCTAGGCSPHLLLPTSDCGGTTWQAAFDRDGLGPWTFEDTASDAVAWHVSERRTFGGAATLRAGNVLCTNYHGGPQAGPCAAAPGPDGPIHLVARTPLVHLPAGAPSVLLVWVWLDVADAARGAIDGLAIDVMTAANMGIATWSTRAHALPARTWTPVALDLSAMAGQEVQIALTFDAPDGDSHDHEGAYVGAMRVWTPCASERACPPDEACALGRGVAIAPLDDALCSVAWPDPGATCLACENAASCPAAACERASCVAGACATEADPPSECCEPSPSWADADPSFEGSGEGTGVPADGWQFEGAGWDRSQLRARTGLGALHFGLADGTALAPPGEAVAGTAWTPPIVVPRAAPRWTFWLWLSTEWDLAPSTENPAGVDRLEALVRVDAVPGPTRVDATVWDSGALGGTSGGRWALVEVPLHAWAGLPVRLGWRFATGDGENNAFEGAFIDDASVYRACPGCEGGHIGNPGCGGP